MHKIIFSLLLLLVSVPDTNAQQAQTASLNIGDPAPPIKVAKWMKGKPLTSFEKGKVYVVEFWATWCLPCIAGMPHLSALAKEYKNRVVVSGVSILERKTTSIDRINVFVDSMGKKMDYNVAADDGNYMAENWLRSSGERGIPFAYVVDQNGTIAWMGHPKYLDEVLPGVLQKTWHISEAAQRRQKLKELEELDNSVIPVLNKYMGNPGNPDSALILIEQYLAQNPDLKYAPHIANFTLYSLIKTDPGKAYQYGKQLMATTTYTDPPYHTITEAISYGFQVAKFNLPAELYELSAEAYQAQIDNYPWSMNIPVTYDQTADLYFRAGNKAKAVEAEIKAIETAKQWKNTPQTQINAFQSRLIEYKRMK